MKKNILNKITLALTIVLAIVVLTACSKKFTVTFNSNGGSSVQSVEVKKGKTVEKPVDPTREGFEFVEWTLDNASYDFSSKVTSDITLVAKWKEKVIQNTGEKIDAPQNVKLSNTTLSWDPVDNATSYVVYVNGVAKEVNGTSVVLSELTGLNNIEDVFCVIAKSGDSQSSLSMPYINKSELNKSEIEEIANKYNMPKEVAEEVLYAMKKYNLTIEEIDKVFEAFDVTTPQAMLVSMMKLLNHKSFKGIVDAVLSSSYAYANQMLDSLTAVPVPPVTATEENAVEQLYATIKLCGYEGKATSKEDKLFTELVLPFLYCSASTSNMGVNAMMSSTMFYGYYLNKVDFSASRNNQVITVKVNNQTIETNFNELYQLFTIALSQDMTDYQSTLATLFMAKVYPFAVQDVNLFKEQFSDFYARLKAIVSTQLDVLVNGINNILSATEIMNSLMVAVQDVIAKSQTVSDEAGLKALVESVNNFKNQALDALIEVLPNEEQYNVIAELISAFAELSKNGDEIIKNLSYENVKDVKKLLSAFKTIDLTKYDLMPVIEAVMTQDETAMEKAQALLAQMLKDIENVLPLQQVVKPTLDEQAKAILNYLQSLEKDSFPVLSLLNVLFGTEIKEENIKNVIKFANEFAEFAAKYEWDEDAIKAVIGSLASGNVNPNDLKQLGIMVLDMVLEYINKDNFDQVANVVTSVLELVAPAEVQQMIKDVSAVVANNLDAFKSYVALYVRCANSDTNEKVLQSLDLMIEFASNEEKYSQLRKLVREVGKATNPDFSEEDLNRLLPTNIVAKLQEVKSLLENSVELTPEQEDLVMEINGYIFPGWIQIDSEIIVPSYAINPEHYGVYIAPDDTYVVVISEYGIILNGEELKIVNTLEEDVFYYYGYVGQDYYEVIYLAPFPAWGLPAQVEVTNTETGFHITCDAPKEEPLPAVVQKEHIGEYKGTKDGTEYVIVVTEDTIMVNGVEFTITAYDTYEGYTGIYNGDEYYLVCYEATETVKARMFFMSGDYKFYVECEQM